MKASADRGRAIPKPARALILLAGLILGQAVLYGPSLVGQKVLLPLDILASPNIYLPQTPETSRIQPHNFILSDLIFQCEPQRRFALAEFRAGRLPMWTPYQFAGTPFFWREVLSLSGTAVLL